MEYCETHSHEDLVKHVNKVNGTFYGSALLDQLESYARVGDPKLLLENSAERKRARVPLMGVVNLTKGDTVMTSGTSPNEEKNDVEEDVSTVEEQKCKEPSDWRSEGPGCFKPFQCSANCPEVEAKTVMVIRAKQRRKAAREFAQLQDLQKEDKSSPDEEQTRQKPVLMIGIRETTKSTTPVMNWDQESSRRKEHQRTTRSVRW